MNQVTQLSLLVLQTLFFTLSSLGLPSARPQSKEDNVPVLTVNTVVGMLANLPCNITPPLPGDRVLLVLWYKNGLGKPLYSFDLRRDKNIVDGSIWAKESVGRANLNIHTEPTAFLSLLGVEETDSGVYRCRVDFQKSPTRFSEVNLSITVPPVEAVILDEKGMLAGDTVSGYHEGSTLVLTCDIIGGWPSSYAIWWRDRQMIDSSWEKIAPGKSRNTVKLEQLSRQDHRTEVECRGNNNNHTKPVTKSVRIDMILEPLAVRITGGEGPMSVGQNYSLVCTATGASPPALLSWWDWRGQRVVAGDQLAGSSDPISPQAADSSSSVLSYEPRAQDEGKTLTCRAEHRSLKSRLETSRVLSVSYEPQLSLSLGKKLQEGNIKEGDDVYMSCSVQANPKVGIIHWLRNGERINPRDGSGFISSEDSLIIQSIKLAHEGEYACEASNMEGTSRSNPLLISVLYLPKCEEEEQYLKVARGEDIKISCPARGAPSPSYYRWQFNSSNDVRPLRVSPDGQVSYTPVKDVDYGSLLCWGVNSVGQQKDPCVIHILPAGKPEPVHNCSLFNITSTTVQVSCVAGLDGGSSQEFAAEMVPLPTQLFATANMKIINKEVPEFFLEGLTPGTQFNVRVFAFNAKGESERVELRGFTLGVDTQKHISDMREGPVPLEVTPLVWVFLSVLSVVVLVSVVVGATFRVSAACSSRLRAKNAGTHRLKQQGSAANGSGVSGGIESGGQATHHHHHHCLKQSPDNNKAGLRNNPDIIQDTEREHVLFLSRRNSSAYETTNSRYEAQHRQPGHVNVITNSSFCTLPKKRHGGRNDASGVDLQQGRRLTLTLPHPSYRPPRPLHLMEESSEEDLTAVGRFSATNGSGGMSGQEDEEENGLVLPPCPPPQFADSPQEELAAEHTKAFVAGRTEENTRF